MDAPSPYFPTSAFRANRKVSPRKGVENVTTAQCKNALQQAFMQLGGVQGLVEWGRENRGPFYQLWSKLIPAEVAETGKSNDIRVLVYAPQTGQTDQQTVVIENTRTE